MGHVKLSFFAWPPPTIDLTPTRSAPAWQHKFAYITHHIIYFRIPCDSRSSPESTTCDKWQVTSDKWQVTSDKWQLIYPSCHIFLDSLWLQEFTRVYNKWQVTSALYSKLVDGYSKEVSCYNPYCEDCNEYKLIKSRLVIMDLFWSCLSSHILTRPVICSQCFCTWFLAMSSVTLPHGSTLEHPHEGPPPNKPPPLCLGLSLGDV